MFIPGLVPSCASARADGARTKRPNEHKGGNIKENRMSAQGMSTRPWLKTSAQCPFFSVGWKNWWWQQSTMTVDPKTLLSIICWSRSYCI